MPRDLNEIIPMEYQAALPAGILYQPEHVGGAMGFAAGKPAEDFWEDLEAEAEAAADAGPGGAVSLRQSLHSFLIMVPTTSQLLLPYNANRIYLMLQNKGTASIFAAFGHTASSADFEIATGPGFYEPILGTVSSVHAVSAAGSQPLTVIEGFRV